MDVLNDILDTLDLKGALYFRTDFSPPWAVTVPDLEEAARFHLVVHGRCNVRIGEAVPIDLYPGDLILIPRGRSHILADTPEREPQRLENMIADTGFTGTGAFAVGQGDATASTKMICGHFTFRRGADHPMLRALPDHLRITSADRAGNPWLDETLRLVARRVFSDEIGAPAAVTRLSEIVFIELLRVGIDQCKELRAIVGALQDSQIGRALEIVHAEPGKPWSVESLGAAVGMSRSRFAERFSELVGMGPMAYLSDWRLQKALSLLSASRISVQEIAVAAGYRSPAAFSRAFSGKFGVAPTEYRRQS